MKRFTLLVSMLLSGLILRGQTYFNRVYPYTETQPELLVLDSGYVTIVQDYLNKDGLVIREYDRWGEVLDSVYYLFDKSPENFGRCLFQMAGTSRFLYSQIYDQETMLIKFNRQWDTLVTHSYQFGDSLETFGYQILADSDSTFLMTGTTFDASISKLRLYLTRLDTNFNILWESSFIDTLALPGGFEGFHILPVADGYLVGGLAYYPGGQIPNYGVIAKFGKNGNKKWLRKITANTLVGAARLGKLSNGNFMYIAPQRMDTNYRNWGKPTRLRYGEFDAQGNMVREKFIGPMMEIFGTILFAPTGDGNFITGGFTWGTTSIVSHLFKFSERGDSLWQRFYWHDEPEDSRLENLKRTPDGGFICAGRFSSDKLWRQTGIGNWTWLLKLDQYGCEVEGCQNIGMKEQNKAPIGIQLYPNPARTRLKVRWAEVQESVQLRVYSATGQELWKDQLQKVTQTEIPLKNWPNGIYYLQLISNNQRHTLPFMKH